MEGEAFRKLSRLCVDWNHRKNVEVKKPSVVGEKSLTGVQEREATLATEHLSPSPPASWLPQSWDRVECLLSGIFPSLNNSSRHGHRFVIGLPPLANLSTLGPIGPCLFRSPLVVETLLDLGP